MLIQYDLSETIFQLISVAKHMLSYFLTPTSACDSGNASDYGEGHCSVYAAWLGPLCMFVFLLVANILMVNLLIARFK